MWYVTCTGMQNSTHKNVLLDKNPGENPVRPTQWMSVFEVRFVPKLWRVWGKKNKNKKHFLCHFKMKMLFDVISSIQNWHAKVNVAQSDSDISFLDENTFFTLTFNRIALIIYWNFLKLRKIVCFTILCVRWCQTEIYCLGLILI